MTKRFVSSHSALRDAKAAVARLNTKYAGTGTTFDWGTLIFVKANPAPRTRPYVVYAIVAHTT